MNRINRAWSQVGGIAILLTAIGTPRMASAALHVYEGFNYPNDSPVLHGANGGTGWMEGWSDDDGDFAFLSNDDISLTNPKFPFATVGDRVQGGPSAAPAEVNRRLPNAFNMAQDGAIYASFLMTKFQGISTTGNNLEFNFYDSTTNFQVSRVGGGSNDRFFLQNSTNYLDVNVELGRTYFIVLRVVSSALENDAYSVKIFDGAVDVPTTEPTVWDSTFSNNSSRIIDNVRLIVGTNACGAFDEIRVGSTWGDVAGVATTPVLTADFNEDLVVDGNDFLIWQRNYLQTGDVAGDANNDGVVDGLDLDDWKAQINPIPTVAAAPIPEPATAALAIVAFAFSAAKRRTFRRTSSTKSN